jgi:hypothetical protein
MIYLIGVEHGVQSKTKGAAETPGHTEFRTCLGRAIEIFRPILIAEEFSLESLRTREITRNAPQEPFTKQIANNAGIRHRFCEPDLRTKLALGYQGTSGWLHHIDELWDPVTEPNRTLLAGALEVLKDFPPREEYWLNQIEDVLQESVIFVCGDGHIKSFGTYLRENKIESVVVKQQVGMSAGLIDENKRTMDFLNANSEYVEQQYQRLRNTHCYQVRENKSWARYGSLRPCG